MQTVSVIVPSYNRKKCLIKVMDQLVTQSYQPHEAFVIDASAPEERVDAEQLSRYPDWMYYLPFSPSGNVSRQRNDAIKRCSGDVVLFLDDDVEFGHDLIEKHLGALKETGADGISGIVLAPGEKVSVQLNDKPKPALLSVGVPDCRIYDGVVTTYLICTANFSIIRTALLAVGGFDEQIHGTLDDVEIGIRLINAGYKILHHNGPRLLHLRVPSSGSRSPSLGPEWHLTNMFYFQFAHFWFKRRFLLLLMTLLSYCRPSRMWFRPWVIAMNCRCTTKAYRAALRRIYEGPRLMET